jgi:hypothetical protein
VSVGLLDFITRKRPPINVLPPDVMRHEGGEFYPAVMVGRREDGSIIYAQEILARVYGDHRTLLVVALDALGLDPVQGFASLDEAQQAALDTGRDAEVVTIGEGPFPKVSVGWTHFVFRADGSNIGFYVEVKG